MGMTLFRVILNKLVLRMWRPTLDKGSPTAYFWPHRQVLLVPEPMSFSPYAIVVLLLLTMVPSAVAQDDGEVAPVRTFEPYRPVVSALDTPVTDTSGIAQEPLPSRPGQVTVNEPERIAQLMRAHAEAKHPIKGYRVQIFLGDRKTAEDTKRAFLQKYPDTPAYLSWLAPNFRLRVGDLRTRLEAEHLLRTLAVEHPGSYIVPDEIEPPRLPE